MSYLKEMEAAKIAYEVKIAVAKEIWVNSSNTQCSIDEYDKKLQVAITKYDTCIKVIRNKYLYSAYRR